MRILVSGGAGFIGSNLCTALLDRGETVYCLDNLSTGSARNVAEHFGENRFHFIPANVVHLPKLEIDIDEIYSLASPTAPGAYQQDPDGTRQANTEGTENMLQLAKRTHARMLFTSSIRVTEPLELMSPHSCYVDGKVEGERLCQEYFTRGVNVKIARLYNTYGPKMAPDDTRVIPTFIRRALAGEPLKIAGDGTQRDSFCYVDDMIDALIRYMESDIAPGPLEFGYPIPISIINLAMMVTNITRSQSRIEFNGVVRSARELEIKKARPVPDIREAQTRLGWLPQTSLETGIERLAEYYRGGIE